MAKPFPAAVLQASHYQDGWCAINLSREITKAILESGQLKALDGHYELTGSFATFAIQPRSKTR